ncbi:MAG: peptide chain release factor 1 [Candidatus Kappaea frigidicola]|nr:peptide chain release factor 1 [Candidatus Kappaea frigidicola]
MIKKLQELTGRFDEIERQMLDSEVISDSKKYQALAKERAKLEAVVVRYKELKSNEEDISELEKMLTEKKADNDFIELAKTEIDELQKRNDSLQKNLENILLEKEEGFDKSIIMEIRAGAGGSEAALFASDLFKMYSKYAQSKGYKVEILDSHQTNEGGFKEVIFSIEGSGAYGLFRFESGTHRVQRVPATETQGRIHTSAATVVVLLEAEEVDLKIDPSDLRVETYRSSGAGGQHVNVTDSAVRITHIPTNTVVSCQDERSQIKNRSKAMKVLRARILDKLKEDQQKEISQNRKLQVGTGDRSQKIRTYNFPDRRVTDHRINFTLHKLEGVLSGDLDELFKALRIEDRKLSLKNISS